jgi:hypothetical protein
MSWIDERAKFQNKFDELSQENVQGLITELNKAVGNYISRGGISQDPNNNPDYNTILQLTQRAESIKNKYTELNDNIMKYVSTQTKDNNLSGLLAENGELQKQINRLEKIKDEIKIDVESAIARDQLLRSRNTDISRHQLFILDRPVRKALIPFIWVISILFIGIGLVIFRMTAPTIATSVTTNITQPTIFMMIAAFFTNKAVLVSLLVSALIVILFLALKIAGVFGK